ncbi:Hypothetical protein A7982_11294 [Minicystis rosea]|nr:Hypothetical protein A7982_11294 [Minicystis rosea]
MHVARALRFADRSSSWGPRISRDPEGARGDRTASEVLCT